MQRASLTVNIDLSDVTNRYNTVLYHTVVVYEKKNRSLVPEKSNPWVQRSVGNSASLVSHWNGGPRIGIFLSSLITNDGFYLSRSSYAYLTWVAMWDRFFQRRAYLGIARSCKTNPSLVITLCHHSASPAL